MYILFHMVYLLLILNQYMFYLNLDEIGRDNVADLMKDKVSIRLVNFCCLRDVIFYINAVTYN